MPEIVILNFFLAVAFILAPLMTNRFFLSNSKIYSEAHKTALAFLLVGAVFDLKVLAGAWPLFCAIGFFLFIKNEFQSILSIKGLATCIHFLFSCISATWFFSGVNDLHLLGYNRAWSFYAALHGSFLGWLFIGCLAFLSTKRSAPSLFLWGSYLSLFFFLFVAFGIDGIPYIKRIGVLGITLLVPTLVGLYLFGLNSEMRESRLLAKISLLSVIASMAIAIVNEFSFIIPKLFLGLPTMVFTHGFLNAILAVPCLYLAIRLETIKKSKNFVRGQSIVFFDGLCVLCNGTVALLIKLDKHQVLKYSSLQGQYASTLLELRHIESSASVIFRKQETNFEKAEAVVQILKELGGFYKLLGLSINLVPNFLLNLAYIFIARIRYQVFGKHKACLIPNAEIRHLFIP
jgi:predicted DCC family thiol-disulfide oxidoreductase YuxK